MRQLIRGGMGLGDAIYVQAVARHLVKKGERVRVASAWPDVFRPLNGYCEVQPFTRNGITRLAHYTRDKGRAGTTQFQDVCNSARVNGVDLRLDWVPTSKIGERLKTQAAGRPIVLVQLMRPPMGRKDQFGASLLPNGAAVQAAIDRLRERALVVQVGSGPCLHKLTGIELDLAGKTTVAELIDAAHAATALLGYVSFFVPLAEALGKRGLFIWAVRGLHDQHGYVRAITPQKVIHRKNLCSWVLDDAPLEKIQEAADGLLR